MDNAGEAVYAGLAFKHFGHFLLESTNRLWWPILERFDGPIVFQNTIEREGSFIGRCAELCGTYHSMMNFEVRALSQDKFDQYMKLRTRINSQTGQPYTAAEALGEMNCGELCTPYAVTSSPFDTDRTAASNGSGTAG